MSVANYPFQDVRYTAGSGNAPVNFGAAGVALNAGLVNTPALIVNSDATESTITLTPGIYNASAVSFVNIGAAQTACQSMQLCIFTTVAGVLEGDPIIKGQNYTAFGSSPLVVGDTLNMANVQIQLRASVPYFVVAATTSYVCRIRFTGMPAAVASSANFTTFSFNKLSDDPIEPSVNFKY